MGAESEGRESGMSGSESIDEADGDPGHGVKPTDIRNKSDMLVIVSIESEDLGSSGVPHIRLGSTSWRADNANGPGSQADGPSCETDVSSSQADASRRLTDMLGKSTGTETAGMSCDEGAGDVRCNIEETDGLVGHVETSTGPGDILNVETYAIKPENETQTISIPQRREKPPDIPSQAMKRAPDEPDGCSNHMNTLSVHTDAYSIEAEMETTENKGGNVRKGQIDLRTRDSPYMVEIKTSKHTYHWRKVSTEDTDVYVPVDAPIKTASQMFAFGEAQSGDKAIAPNVEGERAGNGSGR